LLVDKDRRPDAPDTIAPRRRDESWLAGMHDNFRELFGPAASAGGGSAGSAGIGGSTAACATVHMISTGSAAARNRRRRCSNVAATTRIIVPTGDWRFGRLPGFAGNFSKAPNQLKHNDFTLAAPAVR
jgi:hypothetical protein